MTQDNERKLFENWITKGFNRDLIGNTLQKNEYGVYLSQYIDSSLDAWQARAKLDKSKPSQSEIVAFAKAISKQAVEDYKASLVPAAYFLRESYDGTDEYNQTDPTVNNAMPLYKLGETK